MKNDFKKLRISKGLKPKNKDMGCQTEQEDEHGKKETAASAVGCFNN